MTNPIHDMAQRFGLSLTPAAIVERLDRAKGRIVEYGDLQQAVADARGERIAIENLRHPVQSARRGIGAAGVIKTHYGMGYSLRWA
jgi:DNA-binding response OmpR family regulator